MQLARGRLRGRFHSHPVPLIKIIRYRAAWTAGIDIVSGASTRPGMYPWVCVDVCVCVRAYYIVSML